MTPDIESIVTGGGTTADGEIRLWKDLEHQPIVLNIYKDNKVGGIYNITISPSGMYMAAGSRVGLVRVWPFLDHDIEENTPFLFEVYHQMCRVNALTFLNDDLLLSGGDNGKLRIISIKKKKHLKNKDIEAHLGPVCSLVSLGDKVVASLGIDGILKLWDMDSLSCEFQKEGFKFPKDPFSRFPNISFSFETGHLCCPSADGKLHLFNIRNSLLQETIEAHNGVFYCTTAYGQYLATAGLKDCTLKLWDLKTKKLMKLFKTGVPVLRLCVIGQEKVAAICLEPNKSQSLRTFLLPELRPLNNITGQSFRSIATIPLPVVEHRIKIELARWKSKLIENARSRIMHPQQMEPFLVQLAGRGFWAEAKILQAESAKIRGKPLHELGFLLQLAKAIKVSEDTVPVFFRLALLLEQLNEPGLSVKYFKKIRHFEKSADDALKRLKNHPFNGINPGITIRSDISSVEIIKQEIEKETVLKRLFCWRIVIPSNKEKVFRIHSFKSYEQWQKNIEEISQESNRVVNTKQETLTLFNGRKKKKLQWLKISQISGFSCPSPFLEYALKLLPESKMAEGYGIFNPNKVDAPKNDVNSQNALLAQEYRNIYQERKAAKWLNRVHEFMKKLDRQSYYRNK